MAKGFERYELADRVLEAAASLGFTKPTAVQEKVIPLVIQRRNLIVEAATGTGKTAAYGMPLLSRIDYTTRKTQVLVLVPSRELAIQVQAALRSYSTHQHLRIGAIYGGMTLADTEAELRKGGQIMVAVPGRLKDVLRTGDHDHFWRDIKYLVIDEADKLLEFGFQTILDNLVSNVRNNVQVALFSATISQDVEDMIRERFYPLTSIRLSPQEALRNIQFHYVDLKGGHKPAYLAGLLTTFELEQALIFCSKREEVLDTANFLRSAGRKAEAYHGLLDQVERDAILGRFKSGQVQYLVATDLAARGLDVPELPAVVNFSFPDDIEVYLHRCGRTGRAGHRGEVFNLVASKHEEVILRSFHTEFKLPIEPAEFEPLNKSDFSGEVDRWLKLHINRGKKDKIRPGDIVGFLTAEVGISGEEIGTIALYDTYAIVDLAEPVIAELEEKENLRIKGKNVKVGRYTLADMKRKSAAVKKRQFGARDKKENKNRRK